MAEIKYHKAELPGCFSLKNIVLFHYGFSDVFLYARLIRFFSKFLSPSSCFDKRSGNEDFPLRKKEKKTKQNTKK